MNDTYDCNMSSQEVVEHVMGVLAKKLRSVDGIETIQIDVATLAGIEARVAMNVSTFSALTMEENITRYFAVCKNGEVLDSPLPRCRRRSDWQHIGNKDEEGVSLGMAWAKWLQGIKYVLEYSLYKNAQPKEHSCSLILYIVAEDASADTQELVWERLGVEIPVPC